MILKRLLAGLYLALVANMASALDYPHQPASPILPDISCLSCHDLHGSFGGLLQSSAPNPGMGGDNTEANNLCWSCHTGPALAPYRVAHSSDQVGQQHGTWNMECKDCHNPHNQPQVQTYGSAAYLATGTLSAVTSGTTSTLTDATASWVVDEHAGRIVFPDVNARDRRGTRIGNLSYRVLSNTATILTLDGPINTAYIAAGDIYAVVYGKNIRDEIKVPGTNDWKQVKFFRQTGTNSFADEDVVYDGVCQVCHTQTWHMRNDGSATDQTHENVGVGRAAGQNCTELCHLHTNGFGHYQGVTTDGCVECHGHEAGTLYDADMTPSYAAGTLASQGRGSIAPHSTHTESGTMSPASAGDDDVRGPGLYCADCHNIANMAFFRTGTDQNGDGFFNLNETDVCDICHSPDGAYDGVDDPVAGAKNNWRTGGVYEADGTLKVGKEKWCVGCHDQGTAVINGRQAPDVGGNGTTYGFYASGHGSKAQECQDCHDLTVSHNFDGQKTYRATLNNYQAGYRLKDVNGFPPMNIPLGEPGDVPYNQRGCNFDENNYRLCLTCHAEQGPTTMGTAQNLFTNTDDGGQECEVVAPGVNPYYVGPTGTMITGFRNESSAGFSFGSDVPANGHWDHLVDFARLFGPLLWRSDDTGVANSRVSCPACHNPHGDSYGAGTPSIRMTREILGIQWGTDGNGDYGWLSSPTAIPSICAVSCHFGSDPTIFKYYRDHTSPQITNITVADSNSTDPAPAEAGFTNDRVVAVTFNISDGAAPTLMQCAEDISFRVNATGWIAYTGPTINYTLSDADGNKGISCQLRNVTGSSHIRSTAITLDRVAPTAVGNTLAAPNGGENWLWGTVQSISWNTGAISDDNLKSGSIISLEYSTDGGISFPNSIATNEADDGIYAWTVPVDDSTTARLRISAYDRAGNRGSDSSNADFTIMPLAPTLSAVSVADANNADPAAAEAGYTNNQSVAVTLTAANFPSQMMFAEDAGFSINSSGWITYSANATYMLSAANETKTVFARVRNGAGETAALSDTIILDTSSPTLLATTLSTPNGGESLPSGSVQNIVWNSADITDFNLKPNPIELSYSADGGSSYSLVSGTEANDGSYSWTVPNALSTQSVVRIVAYDRAGNSSFDTSDATFSIFSSYIVTNTNNSGAGSLRQVLTDLVAAGGNGALIFNIPTGLLTNGVAVINPLTALPAITASNITIDGSSQRSFAGDTNSNGPEIRLNGPCTGSCLYGGGFNGLDVAGTGTDTLIKGMQFTQFATGINVGGLRTTLQGNHLGFSSDSTGYTTARNLYNIQITSADVTVGGALPADRNYQGCAWYTGITLSDSGAQIINNANGFRPDDVVCGNGYFSGGVSIGLSTGANSAVIQGNIFAAGTIGINVAGAIDGTSIKGNTFGVYYNSTSATWNFVPGPATGIRLNSSGVINTAIGGSNVASSDASLNDSNVFDSSTYGINLFEATDYTTRVFGNFIGTNPEQDEVFTGNVGIYIGYISGITIGGADADEAGNVIANMSTYGVRLFGGPSGSEEIEISRNVFYNNGSDSGDDAIFLNGGNNSYSRPTIGAANTSTVTVNGVVSGETVEIYIADFGGTEYGEGRTFIGSAIAAGASVNVPVSGVSTGQWVTATRTRDTATARETSAFSSNVQIP